MQPLDALDGVGYTAQAFIADHFGPALTRNRGMQAEETRSITIRIC